MEYMTYPQSPLYHQGYMHHNGMPYSQESFSYIDPQQRSSLYMQRRTASLDDIRHAMISQSEKNETKARLAKDQVEILEAKFQENNKPNSQTKRVLAQDFGVEQARINNWFQNRRAKAKQERKQLEHDSQKHADLSYAEDSESPEDYNGDSFDESFHGHPMGNMTQMPILSGPSSCENTSSASMHSLQRTLDAAGEALNRGDFATSFPEHYDNAAFPVTSGFVSTCVPVSAEHAMTSSNLHGFYSMEFPHGHSQQFPSQLLETCSNDGMPLRYHSHAMMPTLSAPPAMMSSPDSESGFSLNSIPGPSDIASRRAKQRPANLGLDALRQGMGPRSFSSSDVPQRMNPSPSSTPMRRVASNQVNLNVLSGRVQKAAMQLRSPMTKNFNQNCETYLRELPQSVGVGLTRDFPPTPSSPYDNNMLRSTSSSTSPSDSDGNFIYMSAESSNMASPPETPHNPIVNNHWNFEVMDQPLQTPTFEMFAGEMSMPMPQYVSPVSASQPNTPAFGVLNAGFPMPSPHLDYGFDQRQLEYVFQGENVYPPTISSTRSSPSSIQKTFTFSNVTQETLKLQQKKRI